jgi:hypothetical protein
VIRVRINPRYTHGAIRKLSVTTIWLTSVVVAVSTLVIRSGHPSWLWTVLQDCGSGLWVLAVVFQVYYYFWRRRRMSCVEDKVPPNESQITRLVRQWRERSG